MDYVFEDDDSRYRYCLRIQQAMREQFQSLLHLMEAQQAINDDWAEVFGEGSGGNCTSISPNMVSNNSPCPTSTFTREDVLAIKGQSDGENDVSDWIIWGQLKDGRWFVARGGCDYTGWDCKAANSGDVSSNEEDLIRFGMIEDERHRFGISIPKEIE